MFYTTQPLESNNGLQQLLRSNVRSTIKRDVLPIWRGILRLYSVPCDTAKRISQSLIHSSLDLIEALASEVSLTLVCYRKDKRKPENFHLYNREMDAILRPFNPNFQVILTSDVAVLFASPAMLMSRLRQVISGGDAATTAHHPREVFRSAMKPYTETLSAGGAIEIEYLFKIFATTTLSMIDRVWSETVRDALLKPVVLAGPGTQRTVVRKRVVVQCYEEMCTAMRIAIEEIREYANQNSL